MNWRALILYSFSMLDPEFMPFVFFGDYDYFVVEFLIRNKKIWLGIKILDMTKESFCIVNDTFPEDTPRGSLRGKNFGNAQICRASLLSFPCCNMHYVIKISEILWNGQCNAIESLSIVIVECVPEYRRARATLKGDKRTCLLFLLTNLFFYWRAMRQNIL